MERQSMSPLKLLKTLSKVALEQAPKVWHRVKGMYIPYSINCPGRLFNFGPMRVGTYSRVGAYYFPNIFNKRGHF